MTKRVWNRAAAVAAGVALCVPLGIGDLGALEVDGPGGFFAAAPAFATDSEDNIKAIVPGTTMDGKPLDENQEVHLTLRLRGDNPNNDPSASHTTGSTTGYTVTVTKLTYTFNPHSVDCSNLRSLTVAQARKMSKDRSWGGTTDANGEVSFPGLAPGLYLIEIATPSGPTQTYQKFQTTLAWLPIENQTQAGQWQYLVGIQPKPVKPQPPKPNSNNGGGGVVPIPKPSEDPKPKPSEVPSQGPRPEPSGNPAPYPNSQPKPSYLDPNDPLVLAAQEEARRRAEAMRRRAEAIAAALAATGAEVWVPVFMSAGLLGTGFILLAKRRRREDD